MLVFLAGLAGDECCWCVVVESGLPPSPRAFFPVPVVPAEEVPDEEPPGPRPTGVVLELIILLLSTTSPSVNEPFNRPTTGTRNNNGMGEGPSRIQNKTPFTGPGNNKPFLFFNPPQLFLEMNK
jgi:hypothetical protein